MKKIQILIVDDEESIRYTFECFLVDEGYEVITAQDYEEALEKIADGGVDLIFADILLGGMTGMDILREVRAANINCPVIMITGSPNIDTASEAVRLGAFDYIPKPVIRETLLQVTRQALAHKTLQDEKERYRSNLEAIFRSVKDAIITVNPKLQVIEINDAASKLCGHTRDAIGKEFSTLPRGCNGSCLKVLSKIVEKKESFELSHIECQRSRRPGQVVTLTSSPLLDSHDRFIGAVLVVRDETRLADLERSLNERQKLHKMMGQNSKMQQIYSLIEDLADVQTTVLITGESGTGKELVAEAVHYRGERRDKPLVKVNCSALPETLLESELFGHVKGAFTGAVKDKIGRFQRADGGTIFLDEIGDVSPRMQLRLLRVLQEMEFEPVGDSTPIRVDVRVVAATNQNLYEKVRSGEFREDLYYRLRVVEIPLPPLRDRRDDIPLLTDHFLEKFNNKFKKRIAAVSDEVQKIFMDYQWPGNVRELEHTIEHAFILCRHNIIALDHLPSDFIERPEFETSQHKPIELDGPQSILKALEKANGNKSLAARHLGISRRTLYRKIDEYKIPNDKNQ